MTRQTFINYYAWVRYVDTFMGNAGRSDVSVRLSSGLVIARWLGRSGYVVEKRSKSRLLSIPVYVA